MQEVAKVDDFEYLGEMAIFGGLVGYVVLFIRPYMPKLIEMSENQIIAITADAI